MLRDVRFFSELSELGDRGARIAHINLSQKAESFFREMADIKVLDSGYNVMPYRDEEGVAMTLHTLYVIYERSNKLSSRIS